MCATASSPAGAQSSPILAAWTQVGMNGSLLARVITRAECPPITIDGRRVASRLRAAPGPNFDVRSCETTIPPNATRVSIGDRRLPVLPARVRTVAVLGDTGCRIELIFFQACNDVTKWPFPNIAKLVARTHPDLVIHAGDYYYRETACLVPGCAGSPHGDNWPVWAADFFDPAAPMLAAAPLVAVRGNHEDCKRGGLGWDRFLDVYPYGACTNHERAYETDARGLRFFVLDSSTALDARPSRSEIPWFAEDFATLRRLPPASRWLLTHRPLWGVDATLTGLTLPINRTLEAAEGNARTLPVELVLSGHIHLFEALGFADRRPPQIVVGTGGDTLSNLPGHIRGQAIDGTRVAFGVARHGFGFAVFQVDARTIDVYDRLGAKVYGCRYGTGTVSCTKVNAPATTR